EADAGGLAFWRGIWQQDGGPERVVAGIVSSPEFFGAAAALHPEGTNNRAWTIEGYPRLLNRAPDGGGLDFWTGELDNLRRSRFEVVLGFVRSPENFNNLINEWYNTYLDRAPTTIERDTYRNQLQGGRTQRAIQIEILDSDEFFNDPPV